MLEDMMHTPNWTGRKDVPFESLLGKTVTAIKGAKSGSEKVQVECADGSVYLMFHDQSCCENVQVEDIAGDIPDLIGSPLLMAEEVSNSDQDKPSEWCDSWTWTFYKLATIKGSVTIRWLGTSNGYYGESVSCVQVKP